MQQRDVLEGRVVFYPPVKYYSIEYMAYLWTVKATSPDIPGKMYYYTRLIDKEYIDVFEKFAIPDSEYTIKKMLKPIIKSIDRHKRKLQRAN